MSRWTQLRPGSDAPKCATCYALCVGDEVLYVGQTLNLRTRLIQHGWKIEAGGVKTAWRSFRNAVVKYRIGLRRGEWLSLEYRLITRLRPRLNKRMRGGASLIDIPVIESATPELPPAVDLYKRPMYSLNELAALWKVSAEELRVLFGAMVVDAVSSSAVRAFLETKVGRKVGRFNPWVSF